MSDLLKKIKEGVITYLKTEKTMDEPAIIKLMKTRLTTAAGFWNNKGIETAIRLLNNINRVNNLSDSEQQFYIYNYLQTNMATSHILRSKLADILASDLGLDIEKICNQYRELLFSSRHLVLYYHQFVEQCCIQPVLMKKAVVNAVELTMIKSAEGTTEFKSENRL